MTQRQRLMLSVLTVLLAVPSLVQAEIKYYGYYFAESDYLNYHYTADLAGSGNLVEYTYRAGYLPPGLMFKSNRMKVHFTIPVDEALLSGSSSYRQSQLNAIKADVVAGSMLDAIALLSLSEEWFTRLYQSYQQGTQGEFYSWAIFSGQPLADARLIMRQKLEELIADTKVVFPGIPVTIVENGWDPYSNPPPSNI